MFRSSINNNIVDFEGDNVSTSFLRKVNKYYDVQKDKFANYMNKINNSNTKYIFSKDNNDKYVVEVYSNEKLLFKGHYEIIGVFDLQNSMWCWGWNIDLVDKKLTILSNKMRKFSAHIKNKQNLFNRKQTDDIYYKTKNGSFYTTTQNIQILIKIMMYLTGNPWYLTICHGFDNTVFNSKELLFDEKQNNNKLIKSLEYIIIKDIIQTK